MNTTTSVATAALAAALTIGIGAYVHGETNEATASTNTTTTATKATPAPKAAATPAPTTVAGYQAMFNKVSVNEWGGGDVSVSVEIADGRRVWLYGDTLSKKNGFVNSTALVQTGGTLNVSHGGAQLLPEGGTTSNGRKLVYWIENAKHAGGNKIEITAAPMSIGTGSVWDFKRATTKSRTAIVTVDGQNNVNFDSWTGYVDEPPVEKRLLGPANGVPEDLYADKGAVFYRKNVHDIKLDNGKNLVTIARNRTDGDLTNLKLYAPIYLEQ